MMKLRGSLAVAAAKGKKSNLLEAISYESYRNISKLLMAGADINQRNIGDCTPLIWAAFKKRPEVARLLIEYGANLNLKNINGTTALMIAAKRGDADTALLLVIGGADLDEKDKRGVTALDHAKQKGHQQVVGVLETAVRARDAAAAAERAQAGHIVALEKQRRLNAAAQGRKAWRIMP